MVARLAIALISVLALAGCGGGDGSSSEQRQGAAIFEKAGCGDCHQLEAARSKGTDGPNLDDLKPDFLRVQSQVRNGGVGMPAFDGKLSAEEIAAVSRFVAEATGKAEGQAAQFKPDDRTLADCEGETDFACWEQAFGNEMYRKGPKQALALLEQKQAEVEQVAAACHRIAHTMGAAALARFKGKVAEAFIGGTAICASGYYHGIIEQAFYGVERKDIVKRAREMCTDERLQAQAFLAYQCVHGLGHGLMLYTAYDLPQSLEDCDALETEFDQTSCTGGVFMENFATSRGAKSRYVKDDDLIYPCNDVEEHQKYYCYLLITSRILPAVKYDFRRAARECLKSERDWVDECYQSYGRDVSGTARTDVDRLIELCSYAGRHESECIYGVSRDIVNTDARGDRASEYCNRVGRGFRPRCFEGVGAVLASLNGTTEQREAACRKATSRYYDDCLRGAGVIA